MPGPSGQVERIRTGKAWELTGSGSGSHHEDLVYAEYDGSHGWAVRIKVRWHIWGEKSGSKGPT